MMNPQPIIIQEGSIIDNDDLGPLTVGPFHSNGANSRVHIAVDQGGNEYVLKIHRARKMDNGVLDTSFSAEPRINIQENGVCSPLSTQVVKLEQDRASLVVVLPSLVGHLMLNEYLQETIIPNYDSRITIATRIVEALSSLHSCGWLHGDISSRNIMVDPRTSSVNLIDLEWSLELDHQIQEGTKASGTAEMISPEVRLFGLAALTSASEVWSIAKILMLLLSNDADKEFRRIDDIGVLEYALQTGTDKPLYQPTFFDSMNEQLLELICQATCADGESRPGLNDILQRLQLIQPEGNEHVHVDIFSPADETFEFQEEDLAVIVHLDDGRSIKVRKGRERTISLSNGLGLTFDLRAEHSPLIRINSNGINYERPLCRGNIIRIEDLQIVIDELERI